MKANAYAHIFILLYSYSLPPSDTTKEVEGGMATKFDVVERRKGGSVCERTDRQTERERGSERGSVLEERERERGSVC